LGVACQFCRQLGGAPQGVRLSSAGKRLGGHLLEILLFIVTLGIGWLIWSLIVWSRGQTPAKQLLGMRVVALDSGRPARWGKMFLREFVAKGLIFGFIGGLLFFPWLLASIWLLWDKNKQELWDKVADTIVVDDPRSQLAALGQAAMGPQAVAAVAQPPQPTAATAAVHAVTPGPLSEPGDGEPLRFCTACGAAFEPGDSVFCAHCGAARSG
jgi:uncharacterized RDD family membrane protein YckC